MKSKSFITIFLCVQISYSQNIDELIQPKCDGKNIYYSIVGNIKDFVENDNNLDGREIYEKVDDLKGKRIGVLKGAPYNTSIYNDVIVYGNSDDLLNDLRKHKLDAIIIDKSISNYNQAFGMSIRTIEEDIGMNFLGFGFQKNNTKYLNEFNEFLGGSFRSNIGTRSSNLGFDDESSPLDLKGENGVINVSCRINIPPYSYRLNGDIMGNEILLIYAYAIRYNYTINLLEAKSIQEQVDCLKNKSCDLAGCLFPILDEYRDEIAYSNIFHPATSGMTIRYENTVDGNKSSTIYDIIKDFDGKVIGCNIDPTYYNMTKKSFPNSKIIQYDSFSDLYANLLYQTFEGCLLDKPIVDYFVNRYPDRITYYPDIFDENNYGFGFQKNGEGETLLKEFNEFLNNTDIDSLYYKWTHSRTKDLHVDTNLNTSAEKTIIFADTMNFIPLCFYYFNEPKGFEFELIYLFAKKYNYKVNFTRLENDTHRITYLTEGKANITGGLFSITEERKKSVHFSEPILRTSTVFTVRTDSKKEFLTNVVMDKNYEQKSNNNVDIEVKFSNITKTSSCVFPKEFNDTIIINCTISNITENNPYFEGFEYGNSSDKIKFMHYSFNASTFFKANKLLPNYTIIKESDKSKAICSLSKNDDKEKEEKEEKEDKEDNKNETINNYFKKRKSSGGISTGAILGILIPCILVLLAIIIIALTCRNSPKTKIKEQSNNETDSNMQIKIDK